MVLWCVEDKLLYILVGGCDLVSAIICRNLSKWKLR